MGHFTNVNKSFHLTSMMEFVSILLHRLAFLEVSHLAATRKSLKLIKILKPTGGRGRKGKEKFSINQYLRKFKNCMKQQNFYFSLKKQTSSAGGCQPFSNRRISHHLSAQNPIQLNFSGILHKCNSTFLGQAYFPA